MPPRKETREDHRERLNRVLVYIQENIDHPMLLKTLASVARFSPFHFHRIFTAHVGEPLSRHVRRVRLDTAANRLYFSDEPVTSIALAAGYETPAAFARAFRQRFKKTPSEFKRSKRRDLPKGMNLLPPGPAGRKVVPVKAEIRTIPGQKVLFVRKTGPYAKAAAEAWGTLMPFAVSRRIMGKDTKAIGISHDNPEITPEDSIRYDACIPFTGSVKPEGEIGIQTIAGGRYAVFLHTGPYKNFSRTYGYIMGTWYHESGNKLRNLPCFEVYLNDPRRAKPENLKTEIYVPIE